MSHRVVQKPQVDLDLIEHYDYLAEYGQQAAERFFDAARAAFASLGRMPGLGGVFVGQYFRAKDLRVWPIPGFRKYLVFYRRISDGVEIIRVLHGSRDLDKALAAGDLFD